MGLFDRFKKKEEAPKYDVTNLKVTDLDEGFIFDYNMKSWQVKEVYEYDWGNNDFSYEYMVDAGDEVAYLSVEEDGEVSLTMTKPVKILKLDEDIVDDMIKDKKPPKKLFWEGEKYLLDKDSAGYFCNKSKETEDWAEFISWEYYNEEEDKIISVTQWGEQEFDAATGVVVKEFEISNIVPAS